MTLGTTPLSNVTVGNNQVPASSVYPPNTSGSNPSHNLQALGGGPIRTDDDGNQYSEALVYAKDGDVETLGAKSDAAVTGDTAGTVSAKLRGMNKTLAAAFLDTFGSAGNLTAATTFSGVPTASQLVTNSWVFLANPGGQSTFLIALEVGSAFNGTISFYGLEPDATSLQLVSAHQRGTSTIASSVAINVGAATNQVWVGNIANFKGVYAVCTTFTSGTISAQLGLSPAPYAVSVTSANLTTISGQAPTLDNTNVLAASMRGKNSVAGDTPVLVDASGRVYVNVNSLPALSAGSALIGGVEVYDSAGSNKLAVDASGRVSVLGITNALPAGSNVLGSTTIQATSGTALQADQSNTELKVSNYGKSSTAGDTAIAVDSAGNTKNAATNGAYTQVYSTTQTGVNSWAGSGDITNMHLYSQVVLNINVSAITGTSITFAFKRKDSFGNYISVTSGTALSATGTQSIDIGPGLSSNRIIGDTVQITATFTSITSITFTIDVEAR